MKYYLLLFLFMTATTSCISNKHIMKNSTTYDNKIVKKIILFHFKELPHQLSKIKQNKISEHDLENILIYMLRYTVDLSWFEQNAIIDYFKHKIFTNKDTLCARRINKVLLTIYPLYEKSQLRKKILQLIKKNTTISPNNTLIKTNIKQLNKIPEHQIIHDIFSIRKIHRDNNLEKYTKKLPYTNDFFKISSDYAYLLPPIKPLPKKLLSYKDKIAENFSRYSDFEARKKNTWLMYYYIASNEITEEDAIAILHNIIIEFTEKVLNSNIDSELIHNKKVLRCAMWKLNFYNNLLSSKILFNIIINYKLCKDNQDILKEALNTYMEIYITDEDINNLISSIQCIIRKYGNYITHGTEKYIPELAIKKMQFDWKFLNRLSPWNNLENTPFLESVINIIYNSINPDEKEKIESYYQYDKVCLDVFPDSYYKSLYRYTITKDAVEDLNKYKSKFYFKYFKTLLKKIKDYSLKSQNSQNEFEKNRNLVIIKTKEYI